MGKVLLKSRSLWSQLGEPQGKFAIWSKRKIVDKGFIEGVDYNRFRKTEKSDIKGYGNKTTDEYVITINTAKNICMMENTDDGMVGRR